MTETLESGSLPGREFFARNRSFIRRGTRLPDSLERLWEARAGEFVVEVERGFGQTTVAPTAVVDFPAVFGREAPLLVEIGCGAGDALIPGALARPEWNFLGCEVWRPGAAKTMSAAIKAGVSNVRLLQADASQALPILLAAGQVEEMWTFFPDPWQKARHVKRRLIQPEFAAMAATLLAPGAKWRLATDWADYAWQIRDVLEACPLLEQLHPGENPAPEDPAGLRGGFAPRWEGRALTRFELRGQKAGRVIRDLTFRRRG